MEFLIRVLKMCIYFIRFSFQFLYAWFHSRKNRVRFDHNFLRSLYQDQKKLKVFNGESWCQKSLHYDRNLCGGKKVTWNVVLSIVSNYYCKCKFCSEFNWVWMVFTWAITFDQRAIALVHHTRNNFKWILLPSSIENCLPISVFIEWERFHSIHSRC